MGQLTWVNQPSRLVDGGGGTSIRPERGSLIETASSAPAATLRVERIPKYPSSLASTTTCPGSTNTGPGSGAVPTQTPPTITSAPLGKMVILSTPICAIA